MPNETIKWNLFSKVFSQYFYLFHPRNISDFFIPASTRVKTVLFLFLYCSITMIFGLLDYIKIKINIKLVKVKLDGSELIVGRKKITENEIISISPITIDHGKWQAHVIEIKVLGNTYYFLDKSFPLLGSLADKKSKSILLIEQHLPSISTKINERITLCKFPNKLKR